MSDQRIHDLARKLYAQLDRCAALRRALQVGGGALGVASLALAAEPALAKSCKKKKDCPKGKKCKHKKQGKGRCE
jgi:hypothetical protein